MSFTVKIFQILDALDADATECICHEDFIFVEDYEKQGRDDWIAGLRKLWPEAPVVFSEIVMFFWTNAIYFPCNLLAILMVSRTGLQMCRC